MGGDSPASGTSPLSAETQRELQRRAALAAALSALAEEPVADADPYGVKSVPDRPRFDAAREPHAPNGRPAEQDAVVRVSLPEAGRRR